MTDEAQDVCSTPTVGEIKARTDDLNPEWGWKKHRCVVSVMKLNYHQGCLMSTIWAADWTCTEAAPHVQERNYTLLLQKLSGGEWMLRSDSPFPVDHLQTCSAAKTDSQELIQKRCVFLVMQTLTSSELLIFTHCVFSVYTPPTHTQKNNLINLHVKTSWSRIRSMRLQFTQWKRLTCPPSSFLLNLKILCLTMIRFFFIMYLICYFNFTKGLWVINLWILPICD